MLKLNIKTKEMSNPKYLKSLKNKLKENEKFYQMGIYTLEDFIKNNDIINNSIAKFKEMLNENN